MKKRYNSNVDVKETLFLKAIKYFFENPYGEIYLREYYRKTKISLNSCQRFLNSFIKEKLVLEFRKGNLRYFKANMESLTFKYLKIAFSLKLLEDCKIIDRFKEKNVSHLVLFGSLARGEDDVLSDIDFVCIGPVKNIDLYDFENKLRRRINVHFYSWVEWKKQFKLNSSFYTDVISQGINLIGAKPIVQ